jgi:hypothetical protein
MWYIVYMFCCYFVVFITYDLMVICGQAMDVGANLFIGNLDPEVRVH